MTPFWLNLEDIKGIDICGNFYLLVFGVLCKCFLFGHVFSFGGFPILSSFFLCNNLLSFGFLWKCFLFCLVVYFGWFPTIPSLFSSEIIFLFLSIFQGAKNAQLFPVIFVSWVLEVYMLVLIHFTLYNALEYAVYVFFPISMKL